MSTLIESLKNYENSPERLRSFGEGFIAAKARVVAVSELIYLIKLAEKANPSVIRETITTVAGKLVLLLEEDRNNFQEGWERLLSACHLTQIDLSGKYREGVAISEEEIMRLFQGTLEIKQYASKAAALWKASSDGRDSFSSLDLATREIFIIAAKNDSYHPWVKGIPKSPDIQDFKAWPHPKP